MLANTGPEGKQARSLESKDKSDPHGSSYRACLQEDTEVVSFYFIFPTVLDESLGWHLKGDNNRVWKKKSESLGADTMSRIRKHLLPLCIGWQNCMLEVKERIPKVRW